MQTVNAGSPEAAKLLKRVVGRGKQADPAEFPRYCREHGIAVPLPEYRFALPRKWRFDFAWLGDRVALEVEGGAWIQGRHTRGKGYVADLEKYSEAAARGWLVIRVTPQQLCTAYTIDLVRRAMEHRE